MKKVLVFQHVGHEQVGYIGDYAQDRGVQLHVVELWKPYTMPDPQEFDALIVLGGPMGVYENYISEADELAMIRAHIGTMPMLGICLGSQLIAHALGAKVTPNMRDGKQVKEIGYYDIQLTDGGERSSIFSSFSSPFTALEWHGDAFELPKDAVHLARTPLCEMQAFQYKNAFGLLFHFEFTERMVLRQIEVDRKWSHENFDLDDEKLRGDAQRFAPLMKEQCYTLMDNFLTAHASK